MSIISYSEYSEYIIANTGNSLCTLPGEHSTAVGWMDAIKTNETDRCRHLFACVVYIFNCHRCGWVVWNRVKSPRTMAIIWNAQFLSYLGWGDTRSTGCSFAGVWPSVTFNKSNSFWNDVSFSEQIKDSHSSERLGVLFAMVGIGCLLGPLVADRMNRYEQSLLITIGLCSVNGNRDTGIPWYGCF